MHHATFRARPRPDIERQEVNNVTACATAFTTRIPAIDLDQGSPVPLGLVPELTDQLTPRRVTDVPGEGVVADHVRDRKALHHDRLVLTNQAGGELVQVIPATICNAGVDTRDALALLLPPRTALLAPGQLLLGTRQLLRIAFGVARVVDLLPGRERHQRCDSGVNAHGIGRGSHRLDIACEPEGDKIAAYRVHADRHGRNLHTGRQGTRPANLQRTIHLRKGQATVTEAKRRRGVFRRLLSVLLVERGVLRATGKEAPVGGVEVTQRLLHRDRRDLVHPFVPLTLLEGGQGSGGLNVAHALATLVERIRAFAQGPVIDEPGSAERPRQFVALGSVRVASVAVSILTFHASQYSRKRVNMPHFLPTAEAGGFHAEAFR